MHEIRGALLTFAACSSLALTALAPSTAVAEDGPEERRIQIVMISFGDSSFDDPSKARSNLQKNYFGKDHSLTSYYNEVTREPATFKPAEGGEGGVIGPIKLDMPAAGCDTAKMYGLTQDALAKQGLKWEEDFEHLSMVFPADKAGCGFGGLGSVGGGKTWIPSGDGTADQTVLAHEFGHNFGFSHQMRTLCSGEDLSSCKDVEQNSRKTPMGGGGLAVGLTAPELIHAKWLSKTEAVKVTKSGTYRMRPLYGPGEGVRALIIPAGKDSLVVELRRAAGSLDKNLRGVQTYRVRDGNFAGAALVDSTPRVNHEADDDPSNDAADSLKAGTAFTDKAHKVQIKVAGSGAGTATVAVSVNGVPSTGQAGGKSGNDHGAQGTGGSDGRDGGDLAETGSDNTNYLPMAAGGAAVLALGGGFLLRSRRKRTATVARHAR